MGVGQGVQDVVEQLQGAVQVHLDPAGRAGDAGPGVVGPPALDEAQPNEAQAPQVVHAEPRGHRQPWRGGDMVTMGVPTRPAVTH